MYDRILQILLESSAARKAATRAILARQSGVQPTVPKKPGQFGAGIGTGRAQQQAALAARAKGSSGGFAGSKTAMIQRQDDVIKAAKDKAAKASREKKEKEDKEGGSTSRLATVYAASKAARKLTGLANIQTPKKVY